MKTGYIIEFKCGGKWVRSSNPVITDFTVADATHISHAFYTLQSVKNEIAAQTDGFEYRAVPVDVE